MTWEVYFTKEVSHKDVPDKRALLIRKVSLPIPPVAGMWWQNRPHSDPEQVASVTVYLNGTVQCYLEPQVYDGDSCEVTYWDDQFSYECEGWEVRLFGKTPKEFEA